MASELGQPGCVDVRLIRGGRFVQAEKASLDDGGALLWDRWSLKDRGGLDLDRCVRL